MHDPIAKFRSDIARIQELRREHDNAKWAAEQQLKADSKRMDAEMVKAISELAAKTVVENSRIILKRVIHDLWWNRGTLTQSIVGQGFGVSGARIRQLAGAKTETRPCTKCGAPRRWIHEDSYRYSQIVTSAEREGLCEECYRKDQAEYRRKNEHEEHERLTEARAYCAEHGHHMETDTFYWEPDNLEDGIHLVCGNGCGATKIIKNGSVGALT